MRGIRKSIQYNLKQVGIKHKDNQILNILLIINIKLFIQSLYEDYAIFTIRNIYIRQSNKWYHCDDKHITETNLLTLSNNVYLMFYAKKVDLGT